MKYQLSTGESFRLRTCNDHVLVVLADSAQEEANLNIEGTDYLLITMPMVPRQNGPVVAYFIPTEVAVAAVRRSHDTWLKSTPATKGNNRTWNIWFDDMGNEWGGFAEKWSSYRLRGSVATSGAVVQDIDRKSDRTLGMVIAQARQDIAAAAGVSIEAVKISIALE